MLQQLLDGLLRTSPLEALAVLLGIAYSVLAVRQRRACWIVGGLSSLLYVYLSFAAALPMQGGLQGYYVLMSVYGWVQWSMAGGSPTIATWPPRRHVAALAMIVLVAYPVAALLARESHAAWPYLDSLTTLASLFATWLIARSVLENWLYWIGIDALLAFLFAAQGLVFSSLLFVLYLGVACAGYFTWRRRLGAASP